MHVIKATGKLLVCCYFVILTGTLFHEIGHASAIKYYEGEIVEFWIYPNCSGYVKFIPNTKLSIQQQIIIDLMGPIFGLSIIYLIVMNRNRFEGLIFDDADIKFVGPILISVHMCCLIPVEGSDGYRCFCYILNNTLCMSNTTKVFFECLLICLGIGISVYNL